MVCLSVTINFSCSKNSIKPDIEPIPYEELGGKIAFYRISKGIVLIDADIKSTSILKTKDNVGIWKASVALSHDGSKIAYAGYHYTYDWYQIFTMNIDGSGIQKLTSASRHNFCPVWSLDDARLFYIIGSSNVGSLYIINTDGTGKTLITDLSVEGRISISPNGEKIALAIKSAYNSQIYIMNLKGGNITKLTSSDSSTVHYSPGWSADGKKIVFISRHGPNESPHTEPYYFEIITVNTDGTGKKIVMHLPFEGYPGDVYVTWSPKGDKLAFNYGSGAENDHGMHIFLINPDGTGLTQITNSNAFDGAPSWID